MGDDVVLIIGVADVGPGTDLDEAIDDTQYELHLTAVTAAGPLECCWTAFGGLPRSRATFEDFLHTCELPSDAIREYMEAWDDSRRPIAIAHWGKKLFPTSPAKARWN